MHRLVHERVEQAYASVASGRGAATSRERQGAAAVPLIGLAALVLLALLGLPWSARDHHARLYHGPPPPPRGRPPASREQPPKGTQPPSGRWFWQDQVDIPRATNGLDLVWENGERRQLTLTEYLDFHFPEHDGRMRDAMPLLGWAVPSLGNKYKRAGKSYVWLTLADDRWLDQGTTTMARFVDQLNDEHAKLPPEQRRHTALVTLCLNDECVAKCDEHDLYCYGGFEHTRPAPMLRATWPKVKGLSEILLSRDIFFVDSDVFFRYDPYPFMEPLMDTFDILASENDALNHFNTGWMWLRKSDTTSETWQQVIDRDMRETNRDQFNFNDVRGIVLDLVACTDASCRSWARLRGATGTSTSRRTRSRRRSWRRTACGCTSSDLTSSGRSTSSLTCLSTTVSSPSLCTRLAQTRTRKRSRSPRRWATGTTLTPTTRAIRASSRSST